MPARTTATRLWAILARESAVAVILRRGPSKQVLLIRGLGAGAAYLVFRFVLLKVGRFDPHEIDALWNSRRNNCRS